LAARGLSTVKKLAAFGELGTLWQTAANPLALFRKKDRKAGVGIKECQLRMLCQPLGTALPPEADIRRRNEHVCLVPEADIRL
jgi:hypothetical protein